MQNISQLFPILIIAIGLGLIAKLLLENNKNLYQKKSLMTGNEKEFYGRLVKALPDYYVHAQVCLGAILSPNMPSNKKQYYSVRGTFAQKMADYVICDKHHNVVAIVELDDRTHEPQKDAKRDAMLTSAGYKVIRWQSNNKPTRFEIAEKIESLI